MATEKQISRKSWWKQTELFIFFCVCFYQFDFYNIWTFSDSGSKMSRGFTPANKSKIPSEVSCGCRLEEKPSDRWVYHGNSCIPEGHKNWHLPHRMNCCLPGSGMACEMFFRSMPRLDGQLQPELTPKKPTLWQCCEAHNDQIFNQIWLNI